MFLEATRRTSRAACERVLRAITEFDNIVFKEVDVTTDEAFEVVRDGRSYVVAFNDPSIEPEELERDCGY